MTSMPGQAPLVVADYQGERYLAVAPGARAHIPVDRRAPLEEFDRIAAQIPVFRVTADRPDPRDTDG